MVTNLPSRVGSLVFEEPDGSPQGSGSNDSQSHALTKGKSQKDPVGSGGPFKPRPYFPPPRPHPLPVGLGAPSDRDPRRSDPLNSRGVWQSPFIPAIENFPNPDKFKLPSNIGIYQGDTNPEDHLSNFRTSMEFYRVPEPTRCRAFPMTLQGKARLWFHALNPGTISSFTEL